MIDNVDYERYYKLMDKFSNSSHRNQLIQECAELIHNITKLNQRLLNNEPIEDEIFNNYPIELLHVKLIIDYFISRDKNLQYTMMKEFIRLYSRFKNE